VWNFEMLKKKEAERGLLRLRLVFLVVMVAALLAVGGCNLTSKLQSLQGEAPAQPEGLPDLTAESVETLLPPPEKTEVTVYFKDNEGRFLVPSTAEIDKVPGIAKATLDVLIAGPPQGVDKVASIPVGMQALGVNIKSDGTCVVDLTGPAAGSELSAKEEALVVYAIVNTLTEFENVERVQILVDGQKKQTLAGHIPIDEPLLRNLTFVKS
jgi:germination protein M